MTFMLIRLLCTRTLHYLYKILDPIGLVQTPADLELSQNLLVPPDLLAVAFVPRLRLTLES